MAQAHVFCCVLCELAAMLPSPVDVFRLERRPLVDGSRPAPSSLRFYEDGPYALDHLFSRMLLSLSASERSSLMSYLCGPDAPHDVGSQCSGTDSPILVVQSLQRVLRQHMGAEWSVGHAYSAEKHVGKQMFLKTMFGDQLLLFPDCTQMSHACTTTVDGVYT